MTPQEKIEILQKMRVEIETQRSAGFCNAYGQVTGIDPTTPLLAELGLIKPFNAEEGSYWYKDRATRLTKIDEAISKHQSEINNMNNNEIQNEIKACEDKLKGLREKLAVENNKLERGDIVRVVNYDNSSVNKVGTVGVITEIGSYPSVRVQVLGNPNYGNSHHTENLEKIGNISDYGLKLA